MQKWMSYDGEISAEELLEIYDLLARFAGGVY